MGDDLEKDEIDDIEREEEFNPFAELNNDELKLTFTTVSMNSNNNKKLFVRCTKKQREFMERLRERKGWLYRRLIVEARKEIGRDEIRDIGELSMSEADLMIRKMGGERNI